MFKMVRVMNVKNGMDSPGCPKASSYFVPMIVVLILFLGAIGFALWYYLAQLKPRLDMLVFDKTSGNVGFKDLSGAQLLLQPPAQAAASGQSSRISVINPPAKANLDFALYTSPIPNNTRQQVNLNIVNRQGATAVPLTNT
jgi:hypothetical protein